MTTHTIHEGRNVKRIREILGMKQDVLAFELDMSQQAISQMEQKEVLDKELLERIAEVLKVPAEAIRRFDEAATINVIANNFFDNASVIQNVPFNPFEKWMDALEENKKLYMAVIKEKDEHIGSLKKMISDN
jgi:transcriptional regulator with XRE-family HTH domain